MNGLSVKVYNNNVEGALKILKRKIKETDLMVELRNRAYYEKPSDKKRHRINLAKLRYKYKNQKEQDNS